MITQHWIVEQNKTLLGVLHRPPQRTAGAAAMLMPGFSLPMCDVDYFLSKLAKRLAARGLFVLQLDPYGHGDSAGELGELTLDSLRADIKTGLRVLRRESREETTIHLIGRGLIATLMAEYGGECPGRVIGINPYRLSPELAGKMWSGLRAGTHEVSELVPGSEYSGISDFDRDKVAFFEALGARIRNIHGQLIEAKLLLELGVYDPLPALKTCARGLWYETDLRREEKFVVHQAEELAGYRDLDAYYGKALVREALWQYNLINDICARLAEGWETNADAGTD